MRRPLTVNKPPAGMSTQELGAWDAANKSVEEASDIAGQSTRDELAILNSQPSKPAPLGNIGSTPSPQGYVDEWHQVTFTLVPRYSNGKWMLRLWFGGNGLLRKCSGTYGNFLSTQPSWEAQAATAGFPNYVHDDTENDSLHCLITHAADSVGIAHNRRIELRSLLSWYAGYESSYCPSFLGQDFFPFRSGHVRCNDPLGKFPQYIQEHGPFAFMGNTQGTATTQLAIPPGRNKRTRLKNRGWLNVATECQTPEFQQQGRDFFQGIPAHGYVNQYCTNPIGMSAGRWCISDPDFANSVGTWIRPGSSEADECSDPRNFCNNIDPCYLPGYFSFTAPSGQATVLESEITPFRGLSQAEVEGDEKYRVLFWDWFLNSLGTRTDLFSRELPGMDKWTEASEWMFRTDLMKISWSRDIAVGGGSYVNYRDLRNTPGYKNLTFDWKRGIKMPTLN